MDWYSTSSAPFPVCSTSDHEYIYSLAVAENKKDLQLYSRRDRRIQGRSYGIVGDIIKVPMGLINPFCHCVNMIQNKFLGLHQKTTDLRDTLSCIHCFLLIIY